MPQDTDPRTRRKAEELARLCPTCSTEHEESARCATWGELAGMVATLRTECNRAREDRDAAYGELEGRPSSFVAGVRAGLKRAASLCRQDAGTFDREDEKEIGRWHAARIAALDAEEIAAESGPAEERLGDNDAP